MEYLEKRRCVNFMAITDHNQVFEILDWGTATVNNTAGKGGDRGGLFRRICWVVAVFRTSHDTAIFNLRKVIRYSLFQQKVSIVEYV